MERPNKLDFMVHYFSGQSLNRDEYIDALEGYINYLENEVKTKEYFMNDWKKEFQSEVRLRKRVYKMQSKKIEIKDERIAELEHDLKINEKVIEFERYLREVRENFLFKYIHNDGLNGCPECYDGDLVSKEMYENKCLACKYNCSADDYEEGYEEQSIKCWRKVFFKDE